MRSTVVVLSLAALGLLVYYGGFVAGPKIRLGVEARAQSAAAAVDAGVKVEMVALDAVLKGTVGSEDTREQVKRAVQRAEGVRKVVDELEVASAPVPAEPAPEPPSEPAKEPSPADAPAAPEVTAAAPTDPPGEPTPTDAPAEPGTADAPADGPAEPAAAETPTELVPPAEPATPLLALVWDGTNVAVTGAASKPVVIALNQLMLSSFVADDFNGELMVTEAPLPKGFEVAARVAASALAQANSGSVRIEAGLAKVELVVADAAAKAKATRALAAIPPGFKKEVVVNLAPPPEPAPAEPTPAEPAPSEPAPAAPAATVKDPGGNLSARQCQDLISAALDGEAGRITFTKPNSSRLDDAGLAKVKVLAGFLKRCPEAKGTVDGFHHNQGDPDTIRKLTRKRAYSVYETLKLEGVDVSRLTYQGLGYNFPKVPNKLETRHLNERVEINLEVE
jgi:outer membrane protein OmpA-like peptidoglycan-associated protein